jgi:hypothetical protein
VDRYQNGLRRAHAEPSPRGANERANQIPYDVRQIAHLGSPRHRAQIIAQIKLK